MIKLNDQTPKSITVDIFLAKVVTVDGYKGLDTLYNQDALNDRFVQIAEYGGDIP